MGSLSRPVSSKVELHRISKHFGGQQALREISLAFKAGAVHAIVGENGAGKSTLGKIIAGVHTADEGDVLVNGETVIFRGPNDALRKGIAIVAQEITLIPQMTVIDNVFMGSETARAGVVRRGSLARSFDALCQLAGFHVPGSELVGALRLAEQQKIEILRALARNAEVIVMDEPTAALSRREAASFFDLVGGLRAQGRTIVFISHFLEDVLAVADEVSVLKDGEHVLTAAASTVSKDELVTAMLGRELDLTFPARGGRPDGAGRALSVRGLTREPLVQDVSFDIARGEIVGLAGLMGCGRSELARAIFGADRASRGTVSVGDRTVQIKSPVDAVRAGLAMLPESRKQQGLVLNRSVLENLTLAHPEAVSRCGVVDSRRESACAQLAMDRVGIRGATARSPVEDLSGGNQQKVLFGKWLMREPVCFIADEPTRGVDVGAKLAIYELLVRLRADGVGILLISSDFEELVGLADRVLIMRAGQVIAQVDGEDITEAAIMHGVFEDVAGASATTADSA